MNHPDPRPGHASAGMAACSPEARLTRRRFATLLGAAAPALGGWSTVAARGDETPGAPAEPAAATDDWAKGLDQAMTGFMEPRRVPGGVLAVSKDERLVFARGYGWADREKQEPVTPRSLFRTASISKPITAAAVLKLVEAGKVSLDTPMLDHFPGAPLLEEGTSMDERLRQVTIRHLLQHTGGWDRDVSGDPMFRSPQIAEKTGTPRPASPAAIIHYMLGQPLDFAPGERYAYSNFGYCLLGRIIEKTTGMSYDRYVQQAVLRPAGIRRMRLGASQESGRLHDEVRYYTPEEERARSVFPEETERVPWPYGGFYLEAMDSHGGWVASAVDLLRFTAALAENASKPLLSPATRESMLAPPPPPASRRENGSLADHFYGGGWMIRQRDEKLSHFTHNGSLPGTWTILTQRADGLSFTALFNQRSSDNALPDSALEPALHQALDDIKDWPAEDLFPRF